MNKEIERLLQSLRDERAEIHVYSQTSKHVDDDMVSDINRLNILITALEAQKDDMWIPVTERLPEETGHYKVTVKYKRDGTTQTEKMFFMGKEFGLMKWKNDYERYCDVTAWKPLDEPYEEVHP